MYGKATGAAACLQVSTETMTDLMEGKGRIFLHGNPILQLISAEFSRLKTLAKDRGVRALTVPAAGILTAPVA